MTHSKNRRLLASTLLAGTLAPGLVASLVPGVASAQDGDYPSRAVKLIVSYPPGGSTDIAARLVAEQLSQSLGQSFVVENKPGAGGTIGAQSVTQAEPDGYTLLFGSAAELSIAPVTMKNMPFDVLRELQPVTLVGRVPFLLVTHPSVPARNLDEFIAWARTQQGKLSYASFGNNTTNHLGGEAFKAAAKIEATHVPYKGSSQALADVIGGQVPYTLDTVAAALPHVQGGRLRALAIATPERLATLPEIPTMAESGLPGFSAGTWFGVMAPAGTPPPVVDKLQRSIAAILGTAEVKTAFEGKGIQPVGNSPEAFAEFIRSESKRWTELAGRIGLNPK